MASKIRLLDDLTINKIAAGEVIENPASVVKELMENSLDANSTEIAIEVMNGGRNLIRISDNGTGMGRDDVLMSLERHATSKLKSIDDLSILNTLGFRGEAIPSIASISKYNCLTSDGKEATLLKVQGGKILSCDPAVRETGTTIEIKDLFFNVPVRRKFQRSPHFDEQEILKMVTLHALARPDIKFQLIINQKPALLTHSNNLYDRIYEVMGDFQKELIPIDKDGVYGFITTPFYHKSTKSQQTLFLNRRPVQSSFISFAIKEAFSTHIPANRYPGYILFIDSDPADIDVNVHPQKKEVRLRQESDLKRLIFLAVQEALAKRNTPKQFNEVVSSSPLPWDFSWNKFAPTHVLPKKEEAKIELPLKSLPQLLTTIKGYLVVEGVNQDGISLLDQSRAHTRVLFERLEKKGGMDWERENLLIPLLFEYNPVDTLKVKERLDELKAVGIELREFAPRTFACDSYATHFKPNEIEPFIRNFIEEEKGDDYTGRIAQKASDLSIPSEMVLTREMGQKLLSDLMNCQNCFETPQGKTIFIHLNKDNLTKLAK